MSYLKEVLQKLEKEFVDNNSGAFYEKEKVYTYLMYDGTIYKIGKSKEPYKRLAQLRIANVNCSLICYGDAVSESAMHALYKSYAVGGEWFSLTPELRDEVIGKICSGGDYKIVADGIVVKAVEDYETLKANFYEETSEFINYKVPFGKYKGKNLIEMTNMDQLNWCVWLTKRLREENKEEDSEVLRMFAKWVRLMDRGNLKHTLQREEWLHRSKDIPYQICQTCNKVYSNYNKK